MARDLFCVQQKRKRQRRRYHERAPVVIGLSGSGIVTLGANTLTLSSAGANATDTFAGAINGTGGVTLTTGLETLSGDNGYAGATTIKVHIKLLDKDGKVVLERDVQGKVHFFGENMNATHALAKSIAKVIKENFIAPKAGAAT